MNQSDVLPQDATHASLTRGSSVTVANFVVSGISDAHGSGPTVIIAGVGRLVIMCRESLSAWFAVSR